MAQSALSPAVRPAAPAAGTEPLPLRALLPWAVFAGLLMIVFVYFVGAEQGATSLFAGEGVHEWVHDARHLLGFPCH